ncbi:MAG: SRPBCC family protein [Pseudomonadota bacterium]|nr:SRPBCC family protein [Pseudomonadota bacterium]
MYIPRGRRTAAAIAASVLLSAPAAQAFTIEHSEARYADKHFHYELVVTLDAPIDRVDAVLRDYADYPSLNARILSAAILDRPAPDAVTLETTVKVCFAFFCRDVTRVERVQESKYVLLAVADPARSNVKFSETRSELSPAHHGGTRVRYVTSVVPGFWVPPVGGRRMLLKTLETETRDLFMSVEAKAKQPSATAPP